MRQNPLERLLILLKEQEKGNSQTKVFIKGNPNQTKMNSTFLITKQKALYNIGHFYLMNTIGKDLNLSDQIERARKYFEQSDIPLARYLLGSMLFAKMIDKDMDEKERCNKIRKLWKTSYSAEGLRNLAMLSIHEGIKNLSQKAYFYSKADKYFTYAILRGDKNAQECRDLFLDILADKKDTTSSFIKLIKEQGSIHSLAFLEKK